MWLVAAAAKLMWPLPTYEFGARALGAGATTKALLATAVAVEAALGAAMLLRVVRGFAPSLAWLGVLFAVLLVVYSKDGALVPCSCFGESTATVGQMLVVDPILAAALVALILWGKRREAA
jgi:hypothetical protein